MDGQKKFLLQYWHSCTHPNYFLHGFKTVLLKSYNRTKILVPTTQQCQFVHTENKVVDLALANLSPCINAKEQGKDSTEVGILRKIH